MSMIFFAHSMFGQLFVIRILRTFCDRQLLSRRFLTKIGITFALIATLGPKILFLPPKSSLLFTMGVILALRLALSWHESQKLDHLLQQFPLFIDRWLLNLRTGHGFTHARDQALTSGDPQFRALIAPLFDVSAGKNGRSHALVSTKIVEELRRIHENSHQTVARLENLRTNLRHASDFRRKSGQAMRQAQIQSLVMVALHIALTIFVGIRHGWSANADLIAIASVLSFCGVLILHFIARRIVWTI